MSKIVQPCLLRGNTETLKSELLLKYERCQVHLSIRQLAKISVAGWRSDFPSVILHAYESILASNRVCTFRTYCGQTSTGSSFPPATWIRGALRPPLSLRPSLTIQCCGVYLCGQETQAFLWKALRAAKGLYEPRREPRGGVHS